MQRFFTVLLFVIMASIDNTVLVLLPTLTPVVIADLGITNQAIGAIIGVNLVIVAVTGLFWGYRSDQGDRRRWIGVGTLAWVVPIALIGLVRSAPLLFVLFALAGVGLGCVSTVGYSIITDLVPQRWRGLLLGVWGLAQGIGALAGNALVAWLLRQSYSWHVPFVVMATIGAACCVLIVFAAAPRTGAGDDLLQSLDDADQPYTYRITRADLLMLLAKPSNRWLMLQGSLAQLTFGSLSWIVTLLTARLVAQGVITNQATGLAALLALVFQLGGVVSIGWGWAGDRLQRRRPAARALLAAWGFWAAIPFYVALFWTPLPIVGSLGSGSMFVDLIDQLRHSGWWWLAIGAATCAVVAQATNAPNWYALVAEVNLPEHRGTAFSFITLANNLGRALGVVLVGTVFDLLERSVAAPLNYAIGLTLFQFFFVPAGWCFWLAARTTPRDAAAMRTTLQARVDQITPSAPSDP